MLGKFVFTVTLWEIELSDFLISEIEQFEQEQSYKFGMFHSFVVRLLFVRAHLHCEVTHQSRNCFWKSSIVFIYNPKFDVRANDVHLVFLE